MCKFASRDDNSDDSSGGRNESEANTRSTRGEHDCREKAEPNMGEAKRSERNLCSVRVMPLVPVLVGLFSLQSESENATPKQDSASDDNESDHRLHSDVYSCISAGRRLGKALRVQ